MKKTEFSFVNWLTKKDIINILEPIGIELLEGKFDAKGKPIKSVSRMRVDGKTEILVRCKYNEAKLEEMQKYKAKVNYLPDSLKAILFSSAMLFSASAGSYNSVSRNDFLLKFEDFFCYELLSLKNEADEVEFGRTLTKNYQEYMTKKFGSFYKSRRNAYYKKLDKLEKEEQLNNEQTKTERNK